MKLRLAFLASTAWLVIAERQLPNEPPLPAPPYMVDNTNNQFGVAPDQGSLDGSILYTNNETLTKNLITSNAEVDSFWISNIKHGVMPYAPKGYQVFRNVKDFGAKGDGRTDDTAAINKAIAAGNRCGKGCNATSTLGAVIYFPAGTYAISAPLIQFYYTQFIGNAESKPTIKGLPKFSGIALIDTDPYIPGGAGSQWYINQNNFYRQIRNFVIDLTALPREVRDHDQVYVPTGIHWQVAQATSLQNIDFKMPLSDSKGQATAVGLFMENGSGGFVSDLTFNGGSIGMRVGSQQFTARSLKFTSCSTAISMVWNWGWTWKNLEVHSCQVAINCTGEGGIAGQGIASIAVLDSLFEGVPQVVTLREGKLPEILLDNVLVKDSPAVISVGIRRLLTAPEKGSKTIQSWAMGKAYFGHGKDASKIAGDLRPAPKKPKSLLDKDGKYFVRSKPQYEKLHASDFIIATDRYSIKSDGTGDQARAINKLLAESKGRVVFFPAGVYRVQDTIFLPVGTRIVGEAWSQIMAAGSGFENEVSPKVLIQVGTPGDEGVIEISDMLFTVSGPTAGAILMEWNIHETTQGSAGMWDTHFRVGGAVGSHLQAGDCPKLTGKISSKCKAASLLLHLTAAASGYFENVWLWVADHDIDTPDQRQIDVYSARGVLVESQGPTWFHSSASEHSALYQYQFLNASNIYLGHLQTETPYYQPQPEAPKPFDTNIFSGDPTFKDCAASKSAGRGISGCAAAWALRLISSRDIFIYGAGMYSFFSNYKQDCLLSENCQQKLVETSFSESIWMYDVFTKGTQEVISPRGGLTSVEQAKTQNGYCTALSAWLVLALNGADKGDSSSTIAALESTSMAVAAVCNLDQSAVEVATLDHPQFWSAPHWCQLRQLLITLSKMIARALDDHHRAVRSSGSPPSLGPWQQSLRDYVEATKLQVNSYLQNKWYSDGGLGKYFSCIEEGGTKSIPCPSIHGGVEMPFVHAVIRKDREKAFFEDIRKSAGFSKEMVLTGGSDYPYASGGVNIGPLLNPSAFSGYKERILTPAFSLERYSGLSDIRRFPANASSLSLSPALGAIISNFPTANPKWILEDPEPHFNNTRARQLEKLLAELVTTEKMMASSSDKIVMSDVMDLVTASQIPIYLAYDLGREMRQIREIGNQYAAEKFRADALKALLIAAPLVGGAVGLVSLAGIAGMGSLSLTITATPVFAGLGNAIAEKGSAESLAYLGIAIEGMIGLGSSGILRSRPNAVKGLVESFMAVDVKTLAQVGETNIKRIRVIDKVMDVCRRLV